MFVNTTNKDGELGLVADGEQKLVFLLTVGKGEDGSRSDIQGAELVNDAHIETTRNKQVLEVGMVLRRLDLGDNILVDNLVVGEIGKQTVTEHPQVLGECHIIINHGMNQEDISKETNNSPEPSHQALSGSSINDEGVPGRVPMEGQVVGYKKSDK